MSNNDRRFESNAEELRKYIESHGHMNVTRKENQSLNTWISNIRNSYKIIKKNGQYCDGCLQLNPSRMKVLQKIGFDFKTTRDLISFESRIETLKLYREKYGHINVTKKENKSLYSWILRIRRVYKMLHQEGQSTGIIQGSIRLTPDRMKMLQEVDFDFDFESKTTFSSNQKFKSCIEALKLYKENHGHMLVSRKEDPVLNTFISRVRQSMTRMKKGKCPQIRLTPDRMKMLYQADFPFVNPLVCPFYSYFEHLKLYQAKHGHIRVSAEEDKSLNKFIATLRLSLSRIQEGKTPPLDLTPDRIAALEGIGFDCKLKKRHYTSVSGTPSTNSNSSKRQRVEERFHENHEEITISGALNDTNKDEDMEEIEGDIIPSWLINHEEEEDKGNGLDDEISIVIDVE